MEPSASVLIVDDDPGLCDSLGGLLRHAGYAVQSAPNGRQALETVVDRRPTDTDALAECLGRRWRAAVLAPHLLPAVAAWSAGGAGGDADAH